MPTFQPPSSAMRDEEVWSDFGQKVDLTARLREILLNYPEGTSIVKELVQNAVRAARDVRSGHGAWRVPRHSEKQTAISPPRFVSSHVRSPTFSSSRHPHFSFLPWRRQDDAGARTVRVCLDERQHGTTSLAYEKLAGFQGAALLVFNDSTFQEADFESISRIGDSVKREQVGKTGRFGVGFNSVYHLTDMPSFVSGRHIVFFDPHCEFLPNVSATNPGKRIDFVAHDILSQHPDQFLPFVCLGCDMRSHFEGTMFRFPLRTAAQAEASRLSKAHYSAKSVRKLLKAFAEEKVLDLLYLKNVERIEVMEWAAGEDAPRVVASSEVSGMSPALRTHRAAFSRASAALAAGSSIEPPDTFKLTFRSKGIGSNEDTVRTFIVSQALGTELMPLVVSGREKFGMKLVPWAAVAAELSPTSPSDDTERFHLSSSPQPAAVEGRAFCFLPLPVKTGLPVHVNAYFELSSNRRDIWFGGDMAGGGAARSEWNTALLERVVAPAYARLLLVAASDLGPSSAFYSLMPHVTPPQPWAAVVSRLYAELRDVKVLHTPAAGGRWMTPKQAVFPDHELATNAELASALVAEGLCITDAPAAVLERLEEHAVNDPDRVSPNSVRRLLRSSGEDDLAMRTRDRVLTLLRYCLSDIIDDEPTSAAALEGVPLVPLADGATGVFQPGGVGASPLYVCSVEEVLLLTRAKNVCVDRTADKELTSRMDALAETGALNLARLDGPALASLMPRILPPSWKRKERGDSGLTTWKHADGEHPSEDTMALLWRRLASLSEKSLAMFEGWPLLPVIPACSSGQATGETMELAPLGSAMVMPDGLSAEVVAALRRIGVRVLDTASIVGQAAAAHPAIESQVHHASGAGILDAIAIAVAAATVEAAGVHSTPQFPGDEATALRRFLLQHRWFGVQARSRGQGDEGSPSRLASLRSLRIFEVYPGKGEDGSRDENPPAEPSKDASAAFMVTTKGAMTLSTLDGGSGDMLKLAPAGTDPALLGGQGFLRPADDEEAEVLEKHLAVERLKVAQFIRNHLLNRLNVLPAEIRDRAMLSTISSLASLSTTDAGIGAVLARAAFVPTPGGSLAAPVALYDPRIPELVALLDTSASFPAPPFSDDAVLELLKALGLRSTVTQAAVLDAAMSAERLAEIDTAGAAAQGRAVMRYLETSDGTRLLAPDPTGTHLQKFFGSIGGIFGGGGGSAGAKGGENGGNCGGGAAPDLPREVFVAQLSSIAWVPVAVEAPSDEPGLPWPAGVSTVAPPNAVRPPGDIWLCSATLRIIESEPRSAALADIFGWRTAISPSVLVSQLLAFGEAHKSVADAAVGRALASAVPRVYTLLTAALSNHEEFSSATNAARECSVVWVGTGFARATAVAFAGALDLAPYLHVLPADLTCFRPLLTALGVRDAFGVDDYRGLLHRLADDQGRTPLDASRLDLALWVLGALADCCSRSPEEVNGSLPVPDVAGALAPASELRFNDAPWMAAPEGVRLAHPKLSHSTAEAVGVRSLRLALLSESSEDIGMQLHGSAEAFGQHEALTTRLKHILDAYADGPGVISELIQNADDAGATEVRLMLDAHSGGTNSLLGPRLAEWQGPALIAWNDAVFSPADFHNIARIGQDSKIDRPAAAGRFGLGFNAVYHFTDLPSFVSGDYLVMFDPHATHLPGATPSRPGLKIAFTASPLLSQFPDQFEAYRGTFGCDLSAPYPATLFRFPLRSEVAAKSSEIKPEAYTVEAVRQLFEQFRPRAAQTLLFLKHVRKISVYERGGHISECNVGSTDVDGGVGGKVHGVGEPRLLYEASIPTFEAGRDPRASVLQWVAGNAAVSSDGRVTNAVKKKAFVEKLRAMPESSLPTSVGWMDLTVKCAADEAFRMNRDGRMGATRVASEDGHILMETRERWMVCSSLAGGRARRLALSETGISRGLVPWVGVAARVPHPDDPSADTLTEAAAAVKASIEGRAFCFLPLPVKTGLPVHVNAYFELSSNRRDIWFGGDMAGGGAARSEWNTALLEDAVAPAYAHLVAAAANALGPTASYYAFFPTSPALPAPWSLVLPPLYAALAGAKCLRARDPSSEASSDDATRWVSPRVALFPDPASPAPTALAAALRAEGIWLVEGAPGDVCAAFAAHGPSHAVRALSPGTVRELLRGASPGVAHRALNSREHALALLAYCLSDVDPADVCTASDLDGVPLIPLADGGLGTFRFEASPSEAPPSEASVQPPAEPTSRRPAAPTYYVPTHASEVDILSEAAGDVLVDCGTTTRDDAHSSGGVMSTLSAIASGSTGAALNIRAIDAAALAALLPRALPSQWHPRRRQLSPRSTHSVEWTPGEDGHPTRANLGALWSRLVALSPDGLSRFEGWPLLPTRGGRALARLEPRGPIVRGEGWSENACEALDGLGVARLDTMCEVAAAAAAHPALGSYVALASGSGVLDAAMAAAAYAAEPLDINRRSSEEKTSTSQPEAAPGWIDGAGDGWRAAARGVPARLDAAGVSPTARRALRSFLLQRRWFTAAAPGGRLDGARLDLLRALPVFETHGVEFFRGDAVEAVAERGEARPGSRTDGAAPTPRSFRSLSSEPFPLLAPAGSDATILPAPFLNIEDAAEESLLETHAGVVRVTAGGLLADHVVPALAAGRLPAETAPRALDAALGLLREARSPVEAERLAAALRQHPCVPTPGGTLARPMDLYDPRADVLRELLDPRDRFPAPPFDAGERVASLGALGMRSSLGPEGLVASARWIERLASGESNPGNFGDASSAVARGRALLAYLDDLARGALTPAELPAMDATLEGGAEVWRELGAIAWCPVLTAPPHRGMPWPKTSTLGPPLAPPRATRPLADAWLSSSCMRVLDRARPTPRAGRAVSGAEEEEPKEVDEDAEDAPCFDDGTARGPPEAGVGTNGDEDGDARNAAEDGLAWAAVPAHSASSPRLKEEKELDLERALIVRLGWDRLSSAVIAAQLLELGKAHPDVSNPDDADLAHALGEALPEAYTRLASAAAEGGPDAEAVGTILDGARWLWTGAGFASSAEVALHCPGDLRPYLHGVPSELARHGGLLAALGVRRTFGPEDYARAAARLASDAGGEPLTADKVQLAAALADAASDALAPDEKTTDPSGREASPNNTVAPGTFMLPDANGIMGPASALVHNDADWLLRGEDDEEGAGEGGGGGVIDASGLRLVHPSVPSAAAEALGCRSLRELYAVDKQSTDRLPCPSAQTLRRLLPAYDDAAYVLSDIAEIADATGASGVEVCLDMTEYPSRSLLLPQLAPFQGPAITARLVGVSLTAAELAHLFSSAAPFKLRRRGVRFGNGLVSCCHLTDVIMASSAGQLCIFDPTGVALGRGGGKGGREEHAGGSAAGSAKSYSYAKGELVQRFADQFAPFAAAGVDFTSPHLPSTVLRLPLRTEAQAGSPNALRPTAFAANDAEAARATLTSFAADAHRFLLFASSLAEIRATVRHAATSIPAAEDETLVDVRLTSAFTCGPAASSGGGLDTGGGGGGKPTPRTLADDTEWRRSTLTTLFGGGNATRAAHVVTLRETAGGSPPVTDEWVVGGAMGVGASRDLALNRANAGLMLLPLAAAAAHVRRDGDLVRPANPPPAPAAARLAAEAAKAAAAGRSTASSIYARSARPGAGVCAPLPLRLDPDAANVDPVAAAMCRLPAVVMGHFALTRAGGRTLAPFVNPSSALNPGASGAVSEARNDGGAPKSAERIGVDAEKRREWNVAMCQTMAAAYAHMVSHARGMSPPLPAEAFYQLWPRSAALGLPPPPALDGNGNPVDGNGNVVDSAPRVSGGSRVSRGVSSDQRPSSAAAHPPTPSPAVHPAARLLVHPLYRALADRALLRTVGSSALVKPSDGYFLPSGFAASDPSSWSGFGGRPTQGGRSIANRDGADDNARPLAAAFIARHFPVFDAPAALRLEIAAAGAPGSARELTAAALRKLLRAKPPPASAADPIALRAHVELIECAASDVIVSETVREDSDGGRGLRDPTLTRGDDDLEGVGAILGHYGLSRIQGMLREPGLAGAGDSIRSALSAAGLPWLDVENEPGGNAAGGGSNPDGNGSNPAPPVELDLGALHDLAGVPVPTAAGSVASLGGGALWRGSEDMVSLVPHLGSRFVHPALTSSTALEALVSHPRFISDLRVSPFTPSQLAAELPNALPQRLSPAHCGHQAAVPWMPCGAGGGVERLPSSRWLGAFWRELGKASRGGPGSNNALELFAAWPLVPLVGGTLMRVGHRSAVVVPPDDAPVSSGASPFSHPLTPGDALNVSAVETDDGDEEEEIEDDDRRSPSTPLAPPRRASDDASNDVFTPVGSPLFNASPPHGGRSAHPLSEQWRWLGAALRRTGAPVLDLRFTDSTTAREALAASVLEADAAATGGHGHGARLLTAADVVVFKTKRIRECLGPGFPSFAALDPDARGNLFRLLAAQHASSGFAASGEGLETIRSLPVFTAATGEFTDLLSGEFVTCPPGVAFAETLSKFGGILEHRGEEARELYAALGVPELDDADVLARFIVPSMSRMAVTGRTAALAYIQRHWSRLRDSDALRAALEKERFVEANGLSSETDPSIAGGGGGAPPLRAPGELYDPEVPLLAAVFRGQAGSFPAGAWLRAPWLDLLREVGLRSTVDANLFQLCASRVAARAIALGVAFPLGEGTRPPPLPSLPVGSVDAAEFDAEGEGEAVEDGDASSSDVERQHPGGSSGASDETAASSEDEAMLLTDAGLVVSAGAMLAAYAVANATSLFNAGTCEVIFGLPFVPAALGIPGEPGPGATGCNVLTSFSRALLPEDWSLGFAATPVLPREHVPPSFARASLRLRSPPLVSTVAAHLEALGRSPGWPVALASPDPVPAVSAALSALGGGLDHLDRGILDRLRDAAFVPVGSVLEAPSRLFVRCAAALAPLAHELPSELAEHAGTLRRLGLRDAFGAAEAEALLRATAEVANGRALNPSELRAAVAAATLATGAENVSGGGEGESEDVVGGEGENAVSRKRNSSKTAFGDLPLPDALGVLAPASSVYHSWRTPRALLSRIDPTRLRLAHPLVPFETCAAAGVRSVADAVVEEVDTGPEEESRREDGTCEWPAAEAVARRLVADRFVDALLRACVFAGDRKGRLETTRVDLLDRATAASRALVVTPSLRTRLVASSQEGGGERVDVTLGGATRRHAFYCHRTRRIYASPPPSNGVAAAPLLAPAIAAALALDPSTTAALAALLSAEADDVEATAAALAPGDGSEDEDGRRTVAASPAATSASARAELGSPVLPRDVELLAARPLRPPAIGETCAVRATRSAAEKTDRSAAVPGYTYARVVAGSRRAPSNAALSRVALEVAPGVRKLVLSSEVFAFRRLAERADPPRGAFASASVSSADASDAAENPPGGGGFSPTRDGDATDPSTSGEHPSRVVDRDGGVGPEELVGAVRDLLEAAGAPMTLERSAMLAANQRLRAELEGAGRALKEANERHAAVVTAAEATSRAFACPITQVRMTDPVTALDGHTYERAAIERWFQQGRLTSPVTNLRLPSTTLVPNHALRAAVAAYSDSVLGGA